MIQILTSAFLIIQLILFMKGYTEIDLNRRIKYISYSYLFGAGALFGDVVIELSQILNSVQTLVNEDNILLLMTS